MYLVVLGIWVAARRVAPLLVATVIAGLFSAATIAAGYVTPEARPLFGIAFLAPVIVVGAVETLRAHRIERWLALGLLAILSILLLLIGVPVAGVIPGVVAAWLAAETLGLRLEHAGGPAARTDGSPGAGDESGLHPARPMLDSAPHGEDREE